MSWDIKILFDIVEVPCKVNEKVKTEKRKKEQTRTNNKVGRHGNSNNMQCYKDSQCVAPIVGDKNHKWKDCEYSFKSKLFQTSLELKMAKQKNANNNDRKGNGK